MPRRRNEARLEAALTLYRAPKASTQGLTDRALEKGISLTESRIGYIAFISEDSRTLTLRSRSGPGGGQRLSGKRPLVCSVQTPGPWTEAVRLCRPVIANCDASPGLLTIGYGGNHARTSRRMSIPILANDRLVLVAGVADKQSDYTDEDAHHFSLLMEDLWRVIQRNRTLQELEDSERRYRILSESIDEGLGLKKARETLKAVNAKLRAKQTALREKDIALKQVLSNVESEKRQIQRQVQANVNRLLLPGLRGLRKKTNYAENQCITLLESCLADICSSFAWQLERRCAKLSSRELEVCNMIKTGLSTKEIAAGLHTSVHTVHNQRKQIRKKLGIANQDINLSSFLKTI